MADPNLTAKPTTLEECFPALDALLADEYKDWLTKPHASREYVLTREHHTLGRYIRNEWNLWDEESTLHRHLKERGISHPDDMSHAILEGYLQYKCPTIWDRLTDPQRSP